MNVAIMRKYYYEVVVTVQAIFVLALLYLHWVSDRKLRVTTLLKHRIISLEGFFTYHYSIQANYSKTDLNSICWQVATNSKKPSKSRTE